MTPDQIVSAFVRDLSACTDVLRARFVGARRLHAGEPLMLLPVQGGPGRRSGRLEGLGDFELHGQGCRIDLDSGAVVDFDWDQDSCEVFDGWRLQRFAKSLGDADAPASVLVNAARRDVRLEETRSGWFAIANL